MKLNIKLTLAAIVILVALGAYGILNTRLGVHLALDVFSEIGSEEEGQTTAVEGPLNLTAQLEPSENIQLPSSIQQPSGIKHRNGAIYISTDQTEIFKLDDAYKSVAAPYVLLDGPLLFKQGSLEGLEVNGDKLYAIGEFGSLLAWQEIDEGTWAKAPDITLPESIATMEFSGISTTPNGYLATSEDDLSIINLEQGTTHEISFNTFLDDESKLGGLAFSGIAYSDGLLYILSESYTSIIVVDASNFEVKSVFGIEPCAAADLSIHDGKAYIVIDHNYNEGTQPIHVYDMDAAMNL